jgi:hypothetical protein
MKRALYLCLIGGAVASLLGCSGMSFDNPFAKDAPPPPLPAPTDATITFPPELDVANFALTDDSDPGQIVRMCLRLAEESPETATLYCQKAAKHASGSRLELHALAASAIISLRSGDRQGFLEAHKELEAAMPPNLRVSPPAGVADVIAIGNYMKGETMVAGTSPRLRQLLRKLENIN